MGPYCTFSILTSDRLTATIREIQGALGIIAFQYPDLGSFDCNKSMLVLLSVEKRAFSILTSDRLTATRGTQEGGTWTDLLSVS